MSCHSFYPAFFYIHYYYIHTICLSMANDNEQTVPRSLISLYTKPKTESKFKTILGCICFIGILMILLFLSKLQINIKKSNQQGKTTKFNFQLFLYVTFSSRTRSLINRLSFCTSKNV